MTKFLLHGNAPWIPTGYGVQIGNLAKRLRADGHDVACSATYGLQSGIQDWQGFRVYGCGFDYQSNDLLHHHAAHWFQGEPGWIIIHTDVWAIENPLHDFNVAAWVPIDHYSPLGAQANVAQFFERTGAVPIAMSRFGDDMLRRRGLDPIYVPLSVDMDVYRPLKGMEVHGQELSARRMLDPERPIPDDAFIVGMVAMNKGWAKDRKGFNEAFRAFGAFDRLHPEANAHFYVHAENLGGAEGINLIELAIFSGIPEHKIHWGGGAGQYGLRIGYTPEMMAMVYSGIDVLLAPSHGEGFCVPIIEAHACGTPVIATDFAAQQELVPEGTGWLVDGQPEWDPPHHAEYFQPYIADVYAKLVEAYEADRAEMASVCIDHAKRYDSSYVYDVYWKPAIAQLTEVPEELELEREPMPSENAVAVLCPIYRRTENIPRLIESFLATSDAAATLYLVVDKEDDAAVSATVEAMPLPEVGTKTAALRLSATHGESYAQKLNAGYEQTKEPWVLAIGDDVVFHDGWLDAARDKSMLFDVIGTNDTTGAVKNPKVARGVHADHFFVRRAYVDEYGASLDGPGILASEEYRHWFTDEEIIRLARARGVFTPCLDSVVEHLHPGYDGNEDARAGDPTYMKAVEFSAQDQQTFLERLPLIEQQRTNRARV